MPKRKAESQLTSDNPESKDDGNANDLKDATPDELKGRKIIRARRRTGSKPLQSDSTSQAPKTEPSQTGSQQENKLEDSEIKKDSSSTEQPNEMNNGVPSKESSSPSKEEGAEETNKNGETQSKKTEEKKEEEKKPFTFNGSPGKGKFSFGSIGNKPTSSSTTDGSGESKPFTFNFGNKTKDGEQKKPVFNFGSKSSSGGFSFKSGSKFGDTSDPKKKWTSTKSETKPDPKSQMKGTALATGEEDEETLYETRGKLYELEEGDKKEKEDNGPNWKERGVGILRVNKFKEQTRILMRVEKSLRMILNQPIFSEIAVKQPTSKALSLLAFDSEENKPVSRLIKFKTTEACSTVLELVEKGKTEAKNQSSTNNEEKKSDHKSQDNTNENKPAEDKKEENKDEKSTEQSNKE